MCRKQGQLLEHEGGIEMDFRIGAKSPVYGARQTAKAANRPLKPSFEKMMTEDKKPIYDGPVRDCKIPTEEIEKVDSIIQDTVTISRKPITDSDPLAELAMPDPLDSDPVEIIEKTPLMERLEGIHKKVEDMDFTGKSEEEIYKSIVDAYENEFGFIRLLFHTDRETYNEIRQDQESLILRTLHSYDEGMYYRAMGYDKMSTEEKIAAIKERVGGNSYVHKYCEIAELRRAGVITASQMSEIFNDMARKAEKEYCAKIGIDHITLYQHLEEYYGEPFEKALDTWSKNLLEWTAKTDITWLEIVESVEKYSTKWDWDKKAFMKEFEEISELLKRSDNA